MSFPLRWPPSFSSDQPINVEYMESVVHDVSIRDSSWNRGVGCGSLVLLLIEAEFVIQGKADLGTKAEE